MTDIATLLIRVIVAKRLDLRSEFIFIFFGFRSLHQVANVSLPGQTMMFKEPEVYTENNSQQLNDTKVILKQFEKYFTWKDEEYVLEIGTGCGKTTSQVLVPFLPTSFKLLVAYDKSKEMVTYAEKNNTNSKVSFLVFDAEESDASKLQNTFSGVVEGFGFDKVFSFFCFHWIENHRQAIRNMYFLTRPGAQCFVMFFGSALLFDVWKTLCAVKHWQQYLKASIVLDPTYNTGQLEKKFPIVFSENIEREYFSILEECGFEVKKCICIPKETPFDNSTVSQFRSSVKSIDPLIQYIPEDLREAYMDELIEILTTKSLKKCGRTTHPYKVFAAFFLKPVPME